MILKISELCDIITGRNIDKGKQLVKGTPYITGASNIRNGKIVTEIFVDESSIKNPGIALKGDIIVSCVGTLGKIGIMDLDRAVLSKHVFALRPRFELNTLYLIAMLMGGLCQELESDGEEKTGFSNKLDPAEIMDIKLNIPDADSQQYLVLSLVRYAIAQVACHLEHVSANDVSTSIDTLNELTSNTRKVLRRQQSTIEELFEGLEDTCVPVEDDDPENPFNILRQEQHRIQNLIKII
ncbi:MAG: restriction endonuclease subunit S [Candidatus Cryptobacteroides sp.]